MARDYQALQDELSNDLTAAATTAHLASSSGAQRKILIPKSDLKSIIPDASLATVESTPLGKLVMGNIIVVGLEDGPHLRRFVRMKMRNKDTLLITAFDGFGKKQALPKSSLLGKVIKVENAGKVWDPGKENVVKKFWNRLTEFGTHKPFGLG